VLRRSGARRARAWSSSSYSNSAFKELDEFQVKLRRKTPVPRFFSVWSTGRSDGAFSDAAQPSLPAEAVPFAALEAFDEDLVYDRSRYNKTALIDVMLHIVMHYQEGWGGENFTGHGLRYFEIFNEPAFN
jgi:hypothetical protein